MKEGVHDLLKLKAEHRQKAVKHRSARAQNVIEVHKLMWTKSKLGLL